MSDRESPQQVRASRPTSSPLPHCGTAEGVPTSRAAPGELTRRQARGKTTPARKVSPDRNPGLSAHIEPSARAHQAEGAGCISPPAALAAVGLPGCRRAGAEVCTVPFDPAARTVFTSLSAPEFERCRFLRPPQDPPSHANLGWVRRARTDRQPAAAPLRAASGAAVFLCFCRCLPGIRGRLILRAAGIPPSAGPAFGPVQVEGPPALTGGHPFPSRRRASISKSRTSVSGS